MRLFSAIGKGLQAIVDDLQTPESHKLGQCFEAYVRRHLFIASYYDLVEKTHDYNTNKKDFVESSLQPDFTFRDRWAKKTFYLEVKFRTGLNQGKICWCSERQLQRYREYNKKQSVFILIGQGSEPSSPEYVALLPLSKAKYAGLFPSVVESFNIEVNKPVSSKILWGR